MKFHILLLVVAVLSACTTEQEPMEILPIREAPKENTPPAQPAPDVRNVRWGMTMDEVKAVESTSWTKEPTIVDPNRNGGASVIVWTKMPEGNNTLLTYEFEKDFYAPRPDTLGLASLELKITGLSDMDYQSLVLDLNRRHGKGRSEGGGIVWKTRDKKTTISAVRMDLIQSLTLYYVDDLIVWRRLVEKEQSR